MTPRSFLSSVLALVLAGAPFTRAAPLTLSPTDDSTIRPGSTNKGASTILFAGDTVTANDYLRSALAFDLSSVPAGATISNVTLILTIGSLDTGVSPSASNTIDLHQLNASFTNDGVTWISRYGANDWNSPGGDFGAVLASVAGNAGTVSVGGTFAFSGPSLTNAASRSVGGSLYLLAKLATEDANRSVFRFASQDSTAKPAYRPKLTIEYQPFVFPPGNGVPHPAIPSRPASASYQVRVDGVPVPVNDESYFDFHTTFFSMDRPVMVEVEFSAGVTYASIHPLRHGIQPKIDGNKITFPLLKPLKLVIKAGGALPLALCATPIEQNVPAPGDPNVIYFGPGIHEPGVIQPISGQTVYLIRCEDDGFGWHAISAETYGQQPTEDCLAEDCVIWNTTAGNGLRVGASMETELFQNITFRNIDVLEHANAAIQSDHSDWATCRNIRFENFTDETTKKTIDIFIGRTRYSNSTGYRDERGHYDGLEFINVNSPGGSISLSGFDADHLIDKVLFRDCYRGTAPIDGPEDIVTNAFVTNVTFEVSPEPPFEARDFQLINAWDGWISLRFASRYRQPYALQSSSDPGIAGSFAGLAQTTGTGPSTDLLFHDPTATTATRRFYRVAK